MLFAKNDIVVVGAGFYGSVIAERVAKELGRKVVILELRNHIGGNSYSEKDPDTGIERHVYGSHIFHTDRPDVWNYISSFTELNNYRHKVITRYKKKSYHIPINLMTINDFFGKDMNPDQARSFIIGQSNAHRIKNPKNFEEQAVSLMGRHLYEAFIKGYTMKQWQTDPKELPASIISRIPAKFNYDVNYFTDPWQGIPLEGYTSVFKRILDHPLIEIRLGVDFFDIKDQIPPECLIVYSGPIDRYFNYCHGRLNYRSLRFENRIFSTDDFQGTAVMNYAEVEVPYTRIHEFRYYHPERKNYPKDKTFITYEYSLKSDQANEPYYPVNTKKDKEILLKYEKQAKLQTNLLCGGRLGSYKYLDMDDAIAAALNDYKTIIRPRYLKNK
jgi:UDP-galactopyranose mutase